MAVQTPQKSKTQERETRCVACGHFESEHGITGTRPCLATVGDLLSRDFCTCDAFQPMVAKAA